MKIRLILPLIFTAIAGGFAQTTEGEWKQKAVQQFPELGVRDSPLNKLFRSTHANLLTSKPEFFKDPQWPLLLARQCAAQLLPPTRFTAPGTGDTIEVAPTAFAAGSGTCSLIRKGVRTPAQFTISEDEMLISPQGGAAIKLTITEAGLVGAQTYSWPREVLEALEQKAKATKSLSNAKQLAVGCKLYALDHDGAFPKSLDELVPGIIADKATLMCPLSPKERVGYEYFGGKETDLGDEVLLRSTGTTADGQRIVVYKNATGEIKPGK